MKSNLGRIVAVTSLASLVGAIACGPAIPEAVWIAEPWTLRRTPALVQWPDLDDHEDSAHYALNSFPCDMYRKARKGEPADVEIYVGGRRPGSPRYAMRTRTRSTTIEEEGVSDAEVDLRGLPSPSVGNGPCRSSVQHDVTSSASTYLCTDGHAEIWVSEDALSQMNTTESYLLFAHELGHVAGLAHDGRENTLPKRGPIITINPVVSIMTPNVTAHANRLQRGLLLPVLSYKDEDALEARYCR